MDTTDSREEAVDVLQQLGLKEYEARCFVGLSRLSTGTAKKLSEVTGVPRTRVYDAIRALEMHGLVEVQHSSPQRFRSVPLEEATETLSDQYHTRIERLNDALQPMERIDADEESPVQQVWTLSGRDPIENRVTTMISEATDEVVLVLGDGSLLSADLTECLNGIDDDIHLLVGALSESLQAEVQTAVPAATTFISGLEWLHAASDADGETAIGRLLMIDRSTILVSTLVPGTTDEQAIFGEGFGNGLVVIARRLMAQGLLTARDPGP